MDTPTKKMFLSVVMRDKKLGGKSTIRFKRVKILAYSVEHRWEIER